MGKKLRSVGLRYGLPLLAYGLLVLIALGVRHWFAFQLDLTLLVIVLLIASAWFGGSGPGLLVALIFEVTIDWYALTTTQTLTWRYAITIVNRSVLFAALVLFASSRRRVEREREQLLRREQAARSEAEAANRLKDEFLATVSHELRTPLNAIMGWASLLNRRKLDEATIRSAAEVIERNAKGQAEIINDILDVSRIITGKLRIEPRPVELAPIVQAAIDTVHPAAAAKAINITVSLDRAVGVVLGDADRLQQVVWNLLSNAIKFTPSGGQIEVELEGVESQVEIKVSDNGIGIAPQFLPYVFDRFRQADSSTTREHSGLGLGLAIVRHLVEMQGGTVTAESRGEGRGAVFTVRLPLASAQAAPLQSVEDLLHNHDRVALPNEAAGAADLRALRVLVVDDDADTLDVLRIGLSQYGAEVRAASSTQDALAMLREWKPNVLISDLGMPGEDGFELIEKVRAFAPEEGGNIPAAALTAYAREEDRQRARSAGYQIHIPKPVDPARLATLVAALAKRAGKV